MPDEELPFPKTLGEGAADQEESSATAPLPSSPDNELEQLRAELKSQREMLRVMLTAQASSPASAAPEELTLPSFDDLPDIVEKPEEFRKALSQRLSKVLEASEARTRKVTQEAATKQKTATDLEHLWGTFKESHKDLADRDLLAQAAATAEFNDLTARGIKDVIGAALADEKGFVDRIAKRMRTELGMPQSAGPNRRTQGVGQGSRPAGSPGADNTAPPGFIKQLRKAQLDSGLI